MKKYTQETVVGIFVVIGLLAIGYMTVKLGNVGFLGENTYSLYAKYTSVTGLRVGSPVNMLGLEIGRAKVGGGSDGNTTSQYTATLDGLGPVGHGAHAPHEFLYIDKTLERAALLTLLLLAAPTAVVALEEAG